jgi:hypothetical protein
MRINNIINRNGANMKLSGDLVKDIQLARIYRSIALILEILAIYLVIWGLYTLSSWLWTWF